MAEALRSESGGAPLRVGVVGAGWMGQTHGQAWAGHAARASVVAVTDVSPPRAQALSERYAGAGGRARVFPDLETLLAQGEVDAVDVCLPHHLHAEAVVAAAGAGKHVLCEKPLCLSLEEARTMRQALQRSGTVFMAAHNKLFSPALLETRRLLAAGDMGAVQLVRTVEADYNESLKKGTPPVELPAGESPWSWRRDPTRAGGGELLDNGWHAVYTLLALAGSRPTAVSAMLGDFFIHLPGAEDTAALLVSFECGAIGLLMTSWAFGDPPPAYEFLVSAQRGSLAGTTRRLNVGRHGFPPSEQVFDEVSLGAQAAGLMQAAARRVGLVRGPRPVWHPLADTFSREVGHFLDVVQRGTPSVATWEDAARTLQVVLGAYRAAAEGRVVTLPQDPTEL
jgi:predicted dehydrogenase